MFHDKGNLNFTLRLHQSHEYVPRDLKQFYEVFIGTIVKALNSLEIPASFDPVGACIRIGEKKISGTAGWIKQGISFIHGTLLYNSDLACLRESLTPQRGQPRYLRDRRRIRCMESKRDTVTNIVDMVENPSSLEEIKQAIIEYLEDLSGTSIERGELREEERDTAQALYDSHYKHHSWNLGTRTKSTS